MFSKIKKERFKMKKLLLAVLVLITAAALFTACNRGEATLDEWVDGEVFTLSIGATPRPHMEILAYLAPYLLEDGLVLDLVEFGDFMTVNPALVDGSIDANFFQHVPFLSVQPQADDITVVGLVHIEPMGGYSRRISDIADLPDGALIALPADATNQGRALLLLQMHGLIELDPDAGYRATYTSNITYNPRGLRFQGLDAALVPRALDDPAVDLAIINTNHLLAQTTLRPFVDSIIIDDGDMSYANI